MGSFRAREGGSSLHMKQAGTAAAEPDEELFDIFDADHCHLGTEKRLVVHTEGLYHQSVHVLVRQVPEGDEELLLLQKRSPEKRIAPSAWDLSCAEHLQPGESFRDAALRGLREELSLGGPAVEEQLREIRPMRLYRRRYDRYADNEFNVLFSVTIDASLAASIGPDPVEVAELAWRPVKAVREALESRQEEFPEWFID